MRRRQRLWSGDDARAGQSSAAELRGQMAGADPAHLIGLGLPERRVRHDGPVEAAAAKARNITNKSARAEAIALWLTRMCDTATHDDYLDAMRKAGLDEARAEQEVIRMLACDVIYEPRAGHYAALES